MIIGFKRIHGRLGENGGYVADTVDMTPLQFGLDLETAGALVTIILIDLILSGDNAVLIGMAVRNLPDRQRRLGMIGGVLGAVILRVFFAVIFAVLLYETELLGIRFIGGVLLLWIAWKLMVDPPRPDEDDIEADEAGSLYEAIKIIIIADIVMSMDNMLAVAAASLGKLWLIVFGLALSIPLLFIGAAIVSRLLNRFPWMVWVAGGIIAYVAGELIAEEPLLGTVFYSHNIQLVFAVVVLLATMAIAYMSKTERTPSF